MSAIFLRSFIENPRLSESAKPAPYRFFRPFEAFFAFCGAKIGASATLMEGAGRGKGEIKKIALKFTKYRGNALFFIYISSDT